MSSKNLLYAQSGGVTAVINATACGVIQTAREYPQYFGKVLAGHNGIVGVLHEELIDTSFESVEAITALHHTPGGAFGSCRHKLKPFADSKREYTRLIEVFQAHNIGYFLYNGGGDSQDTAFKISQIAHTLDYPIQCIGIPKTIDNDLALTDNCPGFGSVAKYVATSIREAGYDVASMAATSTQVFVMEVMGRHTGWIAGAAGLAAETSDQAPHIILFPERPFKQAAFLAKVKETVERIGYCAIVVSEGVRNAEGHYLKESSLKDAFGHIQLGGIAHVVAEIIKHNLGYKYHWAVLDYLQRSARHLAAQVDLEQAYALGKAAVELAKAGRNAIMPTIVRTSDQPYRWHIGEASLADVANYEKVMPQDFITEDGFHISEKARRYFQPLIQGEAFPPFENGLPQYGSLKNTKVTKVLGNY